MGSFLLYFVIVFALVTTIIIFYTRWVADSALTDQFRAAESITNGAFPEKWSKQINQRLAYEHLLPALQLETSGTKQALQKIDKLIRFFEKNSFFENAEARELLLAQLKDVRQRWENMTWEEIETEYELISLKRDKSI